MKYQIETVFIAKDRTAGIARKIRHRERLKRTRRHRGEIEGLLKQWKDANCGLAEARVGAVLDGSKETI